MKKAVFVLILILAAGVGLYYWNAGDKPEVGRYRDENLGLSFEYDEENYVVLERAPGQANPDLIKTFILIQKDDYSSLQSGEREGGEAPPYITLSVYRNPLGLSPETWAEANGNISNLPLIMGQTGREEVDGREAISYDADGLYPNRNIIFPDGGYIYHLNGSYPDRDSALYRDFTPFVGSIDFD